MNTGKNNECGECGERFDTYRAMRVHQSRVGHMDKPWRDEERLRHLYIDKSMSAYEIAEELGCGQNAVYTALDEFDIPTRNQSKTKKLQAAREPANFRTHPRDGYEEVYTSSDGEQWFARVHRLCAVAWFGYDEVVDSVVHHKKPIEWLNTPENIEVIDSQSEHAKIHGEERERDSEGHYV